MSSAAHPLSSSEQNKTLVKRWFEEVWNQSRREVIAELFPAEAVLHEGSTQIRGPQEFERFHDAIREQFSDIQITPGIALSEGDLVSIRWIIDCRDKASGKRLTTSGISIARIKDGRFFEAWQNWDQAGIAAQLSA
jgi:predicted ester cyclase